MTPPPPPRPLAAAPRRPAAIAGRLGAVRARPVEAATACALGGLVAGPRSGGVLAGLLVAAVAVAGRRAVLGLVLAAGVLAGAVAADARLAALDRSALTADLGHVVAGDATLLEPLRQRPFGRRTAVVGWRGERVLLRALRGVAVPAARVGDVVGVRGALEPLGPHDAWLRPRAVHAALEAELVRATGRRRGGVAGAVDGLRRRAEDVLARGVPPPQAALLRGMALGQDEALSDAVRDDFRRSGLAHLLAASGQNVVLLAALALALAALLGVPLRARLALVLALIAVYVPLAGAGPSIQRAGIMGAAATVALLSGRPAQRRHAVLLAAVLTLAHNPRAIEEPGWQLSFAAVVAILLLAPALRDRLVAARVPGGLAEATAMTAAATVGTAPLVALHFEAASLVSLPANVLAVPAVAPVMWLSLLAAAAGQAWPAAAAVPAALAAFPAAYLSWLAHAAARVPFAEVRAGPLQALAAVSLATGLAAIATGRGPRTEGGLGGARRRADGRLAAAVVALAVAAGAAAAAVGPRASPAVADPPRGVRISALDVGQGDATLLQDGATAVLVDTGPPGGGVVARLREAGVRRLAALVVTHAQADHAGGAAQVLRAFDVGVVLDGRDGVREPTGAAMAGAARRRGVRLVPAVAGQRLRAGRLDLQLLWPERRAGAAAAAAEDPNLRAVVAEMRAGPLRALLAADAESEVLARLDVGAVDVLKVAHHGSADPGLPAVLDRLRPRVATISAGADNRFGHPAPSTLRALRAAGARVVRTDRDGTVRLWPTAHGLRMEARG